MVSYRPDAEVGIVCHQRHCWWPYLSRCNRLDSHNRRDEECPLTQKRSSAFHSHAYGWYIHCRYISELTIVLAFNSAAFLKGGRLSEIRLGIDNHNVPATPYHKQITIC